MVNFHELMKYIWYCFVGYKISQYLWIFDNIVQYWTILAISINIRLLILAMSHSFICHHKNLSRFYYATKLLPLALATLFFVSKLRMVAVLRPIKKLQTIAVLWPLFGPVGILDAPKLLWLVVLWPLLLISEEVIKLLWVLGLLICLLACLLQGDQTVLP